jgi:hypothetical protein
MEKKFNGRQGKDQERGIVQGKDWTGGVKVRVRVWIRVRVRVRG